MATNLGKAYVQIMPSARGISGMISNEINGEAAVTGRSAGGSLVAAFKNVVAVAAIGKFFTSSLIEGGKLQQSLGGVETLFKNNADTVKQYANEAYKTTGLSANAYMENVTSFSAGLISSLGGDTAKAAKVANMAMVDMADNSNKMGTSMELIQNAYQGFAKQNYTMLDNLKLGYGGTKKEMERLLADAQKITGVKYDINNLNDVYQAIHAIQGKLGITGTTAKEAATTLQGSFASMKASFSNVLGKLSLGEDIRPSLEELGKTTSTFVVGNLLPMVGNLLKGLPTLLFGALSGLAGLLKGVLGESVVKNIQKTLDQISATVDSFIGVLFGKMSKQEGIDLMKSLGIDEKTAEKIITIAENLRISFENIWGAVKNVATIIGDIAVTILGLDGADGSINPIATAFGIVSAVLKKVTEWLKKFTGWLKENKLAMDLIKVALTVFIGRLIALKIIAVVVNLFKALNLAITAVRVGWVILTVVMSLNPFVAIATAIAAVVAGLLWFFTQTETGKRLWTEFVTFLTSLWTGVQIFFSTLWTTITTAITTAWTSIVTFFSGIWLAITTAITTVWNGIKEFFTNLWISIKTKVEEVWNGIKEFFTNLWISIKTKVEEVWNGIKEFFTNLWISIKTKVEEVWNGIKEYLYGLWYSLKAKVEEIWNGVKDYLYELWYSIKSKATTAWEELKAKVVGIVNDLVDGAKRAWEDLKKSVSETVEKVKKFFDKLSEINLWDAGWEIINGFLNGLRRAYDNVKEFIGGIATWIRNNKGPIEYDRKLLIPAGNAIMGGFNESLQDKFKTVQQTVKGMAGAINKGFTSEIADFEFNDNIQKDLNVAAKSKFDFDFGVNKNDDVVNALGIVQGLLEKISNKDNNTYLDGELLAKNSYDRQMTFVRREGI